VIFIKKPDNGHLATDNEYEFIIMHPYKRSARVSDLIREEIADIIMTRIKHKTIGFVTVTGAKVSDDLRNATIYLSVLDDDAREKTLRKLSSMSAVLRSELGRRLKMKYTPLLKFRIDESIDYGRKIDGILNDIESERSSIENDEDLF
jgi:ribosome-binding factor A